MTTADQLAIVNRLLHAPEEAYSLAQVRFQTISRNLTIYSRLAWLWIGLNRRGF